MNQRMTKLMQVLDESFHELGMYTVRVACASLFCQLTLALCKLHTPPFTVFFGESLF